LKKHDDFLKYYFSKPNNIGKSIPDAFDELKKIFSELSISKSAVYQRIRKLKFTFKKVTSLKINGNLFSNKIKRKHYCKDFLELFNSDFKFIFLDECSFNFNLHPNYAWFPSNARAIESVEIKSINYSMLAFLSLEGACGFSIT